MANLSSVITQTVGNSSGGVNLITAPSQSSIWTATGLTLSTTTTAAELPLEGFSSSAVKFLLTGSTTSAYVDFLVPTALAQTKLGLQWYARANVTTIGSITLSLSSYASAGNRTSNTSPTTVTLQTSSVASAATSFNTTFDTASQQYYRLTFNFPASASNWYTLAQFVLGPGVITQGAAVSEWQSYTCTLTASGGGSVSAGTGGNASTSGRWRRVGNTMEMNFQFVWGTSGEAFGTSGTYIVGLPTGYTVDATQLPTVSAAGDLCVGHGALYDADLNDSYGLMANWSGTAIRFLVEGSTSGAGVGKTTPITMAAGDGIWANIKVPIAEWAGNGTVNLGAGAQVEYAYNTSTATTGNDTTSFGYGPSGTQFYSITAAGSRRVQFQYPIQQDDIITLQTTFDGGVTWGDVATFNQASVQAYTVQNSVTYGMQWVQGTSSYIDVEFGTYRYASGLYAAVGSAWSGVAGSASYKWRVRKAKASSPVGFGLAGTDGSSGLYKAGQAPGLVTGAAIPAGYIGQVLTASGSAVAGGASSQYANCASITLTAGHWLVTGGIIFAMGAATAADTALTAISGYSANTNTDHTTGVNVYAGRAPSTADTNASGVVPSIVVRSDGTSLYIGSFTVTGQILYLKGRVTWTTAAPNLSGTITAVRIA